MASKSRQRQSARQRRRRQRRPRRPPPVETAGPELGPTFVHLPPHLLGRVTVHVYSERFHSFAFVRPCSMSRAARNANQSSQVPLVAKSNGAAVAAESWRRAAYVAALQKRARHLRCFCSECGVPCSLSETVNAPDHLVVFRRSGGREIGDGRVAVGTNGTMLRRLHRDRGTRRRISRMLSLVLAELPARRFIPRKILWNWKSL